MNDIDRQLYGDEFVDAVTAIRFFRSFDSIEDAISDTLSDLFFARFDEVERWAAEHDSRHIHDQAWRLHDMFLRSRTVAEEMDAYHRLLQLLARIRPASAD